jgi:hypothetical protein
MYILPGITKFKKSDVNQYINQKTPKPKGEGV